MKDEILIKYLLGEATVEEAAWVGRWLEQNSDNEAYYLSLKELWDKSKLLEVQPEHGYDTEVQWHRLQSEMRLRGAGITRTATADNTEERKVRERPGSGKVIDFRFWIGVAAVVVLLMGGWYVWNTLLSTGKAGAPKVFTAAASPLTDTLSDGSVITLNRYSSLQISTAFGGKNREVTLQDGEVFFNVAHNAKKPFLVHIDAIDVKVLGTSFNIKKRGKQTIIDVATGKVMVYYKGKSLILHAQEKMSIDPGTTQLIRQKNQGLLYNYYVTNKFIANNTRLEDLVRILNEAYGRHIVFGRPELKDMRITTVFSKESLETILNVISETFAIKVIYRKDRIELW